MKSGTTTPVDLTAVITILPRRPRGTGTTATTIGTEDGLTSCASGIGRSFGTAAM